MQLSFCRLSVPQRKCGEASCLGMDGSISQRRFPMRPMHSRRDGDTQRLNVAAADKSQGLFGGLCGEDAASEMPQQRISGGLRTSLYARPGLGWRLCSRGRPLQWPPSLTNQQRHYRLLLRYSRAMAFEFRPARGQAVRAAKLLSLGESVQWCFESFILLVATTETLQRRRYNREREKERNLPTAIPS